MKPVTYKNIRRRLGLSEEELAKRLGVHLTTIYRRESGKIAITPQAENSIKALRLAMEPKAA